MKRNSMSGLLEVRRHLSDASVHLDAVRGLAALVVFLGHGQSLFLASGLHLAPDGKTTAEASTSPITVAVVPPPASASMETVGHEAVMVFFVLSGYFVGGSALRAVRKGYLSWKKYLFQRLTRLWL